MHFWWENICCSPKIYVTTHQANKHTPPYCILILRSCRRRPLCCPPLPMPITGRHCSLTYPSLFSPPTIRPLGAASLVCWWGWEGAIGQKMAPPGNRRWQGRATKLVVLAAIDYDMFLYHLFVFLFFALQIEVSTMQPVPTCDGFTFFIRESVPLTGRSQEVRKKPSWTYFFFDGTDNFWLVVILWHLSVLQGQSVITKTKI